MIADLIDQALLNRRQDHRDTAGGALWRASTLGYCLAKQVLMARGTTPPAQFDARQLRVFEVGHVTAQWFKNLLIEADAFVADEVPLYDAELDLGCHIDFIVKQDGKYKGVELKSKNSKSFWYAANSNGVVAGEHQLVQAAACAVLAERQGLSWPVEDWSVVVVSKDDLTIHEDKVTQQHRDEVFMRIATLNDAMANGSLPACSCLDSWWWRYCELYEGSEESKKYKKGGYKPDGPCCSEAWLLRR